MTAFGIVTVISVAIVFARIGGIRAEAARKVGPRITNQIDDRRHRLFFWPRGS